MACSKPILAMINGEGGRVVLEANAGLVCQAESPVELSANILRMKSMKAEELLEMGLNARRYYNENFERGYLFDKAESIFEEML